MANSLQELLSEALPAYFDALPSPDHAAIRIAEQVNHFYAMQAGNSHMHYIAAAIGINPDNLSANMISQLDTRLFTPMASGRTVELHVSLIHTPSRSLTLSQIIADEMLTTVPGDKRSGTEHVLLEPVLDQLQFAAHPLNLQVTTIHNESQQECFCVITLPWLTNPAAASTRSNKIMGKYMRIFNHRLLAENEPEGFRLAQLELAQLALDALTEKFKSQH